MGMLSGLLGRKRRERVDARKIYDRLMAQSRLPQFFGEGRIPDTYEGRIELLTFHMAFAMKAMRAHGEQGQRLSQALFDEMVDDFDISLREEGLTDSGVKRRIKPIVKLFYTRLKAITESKDVPELESVLETGELKDGSEGFSLALARYGIRFGETLSACPLGEMASAKFDFPDISI